MPKGWSCGMGHCEEGYHTVCDEYSVPCMFYPHQHTCFAVNFCDESWCENRHCDCGADVEGKIS